LAAYLGAFDAVLAVLDLGAEIGLRNTRMLYKHKASLGAAGQDFPNFSYH
jgi:hypothetical protein